ncbi:MAG: poly(A) polymerase [Bdellovibrionaceae bacterium]|nr:poly(A) polymerase [Pseudobdellovibrionaceae bacterium]MBX3033018.1 poly(A) polymerase [Pseudobdellovibrionaceae bacterium]
MLNVPKPTLHEDWIDLTARKIVQTLQTSGYETYLVGGCVRDLLAGIHPKDFDIATNALPNEVKKKVPGSYVIGKRFRLVLVKRGESQFEVATFRRNVRPEDLEAEENAVTGDNYFGTCEEDARRRDFTINALFYDPIQHRLIDYVEGQKDIQACTIRMIGDPKERFLEDPIRLLRALRLSHKLMFRLDPELRAAMTETAESLQKSVLPRRREEYLKLLRLKEPGRAWAELFDLGLMAPVLPGLHELYQDAEQSRTFERYLLEIPRVGIDMGSPLELFAGFLYAFLRAKHPENDLDAAQIENSPRWNGFMKDELGMFKVEAAVFLKCLDLLPALFRTEAYLKKGGRRKVGFLRNDSLPLALKLSQIDGFLPPEEFDFWVEQIRANSAEIWASRPQF